jgi:hypothetical protein
MLSQIPEGVYIYKIHPYTYNGYQIRAHHFEEAIGRQRAKNKTQHQRRSSMENRQKSQKHCVHPSMQWKISPTYKL